MIKGLKDGTIDCIASDHAPHSIEEKESEFQFAPNGIVGLETIVGLSFTELLHKNKISIEELINKLSINPRKILNIPIPKFEIGSIANFTIIDPDLVWTVDISKFKSKSKNSPFDKRLLTGKAIAVINRKKMYADNQWIDLAGA
jgi:dihydroorotase